MNALFGAWGGAGTARPGTAQSEGTSLLADWNNYNAPDVEGGVGAPTASTSDTLFQSVESARMTGSNLLSASFNAIRGGGAAAPGAPATTPAVASESGRWLPTSESFSVPTAMQLAYFFSFLAAGGVFLMLSFTIFLPIIIVAPSKFAMSFTLGCLSVMAAFSALRGLKQQLQHMMSKERMPFSAAYLGTIFLTLYSALIMHSYLLCLISSAAQMVALMYYLMSYFPGGADGVKFMLNLFYQAAASCFRSFLSK